VTAMMSLKEGILNDWKNWKNAIIMIMMMLDNIRDGRRKAMSDRMIVKVGKLI